jgi:hypothetical protein
MGKAEAEFSKFDFSSPGSVVADSSAWRWQPINEDERGLRESGPARQERLAK